MEAPRTDAPHRMSPEDAAAKADALIAQYRATQATRPSKGMLQGSRATPTVGASRGLGVRATIAVAFAAGILAAGGWHAHPVAWVALVGVPLVAFGPRFVARDGNDVARAHGREDAA